MCSDVKLMYVQAGLPSFASIPVTLRTLFKKNRGDRIRTPLQGIAGWPMGWLRCPGVVLTYCPGTGPKFRPDRLFAWLNWGCRAHTRLKGSGPGRNTHMMPGFAMCWKLLSGDNAGATRFWAVPVLVWAQRLEIVRWAEPAPSWPRRSWAGRQARRADCWRRTMGQWRLKIAS